MGSTLGFRCGLSSALVRNSPPPVGGVGTRPGRGGGGMRSVVIVGRGGGGGGGPLPCVSSGAGFE